MDIAKEIANKVNIFYNDLKSDENGRYKSWEHCYFYFSEARKKDSDKLRKYNNEEKIDYLALHLAFYLASWGMYRGSSFVLQQDYKVHIPAVKKILNEKYNPLFGIKCSDLKNKSNQNLLEELYDCLIEYYSTIRDEIKRQDIKNKVSDILITKILMGTMGCVPAYDRYFVAGVRNKKVTTGKYSIKSLSKLVDFYENNNSIFENIKKDMKIDNLEYPPMKILDMGFWKLGIEIESKNKIN